MSEQTRLATLEALARANEQKLEELGHTNWLLSNSNTKTGKEPLQFESDLRNNTSHFSYDNVDLEARKTLPSHAPLLKAHVPQHRPRLHHRPQHGRWPEHPETPYDVAARGAPRLQLSFIIPGCLGETLPVEVDSLDLAFVLQQALRRKGWREEMTHRGIEDFLEQPIIGVMWTGREGKIGKLA